MILYLVIGFIILAILQMLEVGELTIGLLILVLPVWPFFALVCALDRWVGEA